MGVADYELDACEAALFERAMELAPQALAVTDLEAEQFPAAVSVHAHGQDEGPGAELHGSAGAAVQVGGARYR